MLIGSNMTRLLALAIQFTLCGRVLALTQTAVPISGAHDVIVDDGHNQIYVTTSTGSVQRYDLGTHALTTPWNVGVNLRALDLTADGNWIYIADQSAGPTQGVIRKVNTATGDKSNIFYDLAGEGAGAYDIVRLNNNKMLFTANHQFSGGSSPVRFINLASDAVTIRPSDGVERQTDLFRSANGARVFMTGGNTSAGDIRVYDALTDSYAVTTNLWEPLNGINAALSPNGSLLAFQGFNVPLSLVHSSDLSLVDTLPTYRSGLGFSPAGYLFMADWQTDVFRVYNPVTQSEVTQFAAGFDLDPFSPGNIAFSGTGGTMVFQDPGGIHIYEGVLVPEPASLSLLATAGIAGLLRRRRTL